MKKIIAGIKWIRFFDKDNDKKITYSGDVWPIVIPIVYTFFVGFIVALHWKMEQIPTDTTITWLVIGSLGAQAIEALKYMKTGGGTVIKNDDEHKPPGIDSY